MTDGALCYFDQIWLLSRMWQLQTHRDEGTILQVIQIIRNKNEGYNLNLIASKRICLVVRFNACEKVLN